MRLVKGVAWGKVAVDSQAYWQYCGHMCFPSERICEFHTELSFAYNAQRNFDTSEWFEVNRDARVRENIQDIRLLLYPKKVIQSFLFRITKVVMNSNKHLKWCDVSLLHQMRHKIKTIFDNFVPRVRVPLKSKGKEGTPLRLVLSK